MRGWPLVLLLGAGCDDGAGGLPADGALDGAPDVSALVDARPAVDVGQPDEGPPDAAAPLPTLAIDDAGLALPSGPVVRVRGRAEGAESVRWRVEDVGEGELTTEFDLRLRAPPGLHVVEVVAESAAGAVIERRERAVGAMLAVGLSHSLAVVGGRLTGWGSNAAGQLGGDGPDRATPGPIAGIDARGVAASGSTSAAIDGQGRVWLWGGDGAPPAELAIDDAVALALGGGHLLALRSDGAVWSMGLDGDGQLGREGPADVPGRVVGLEDIVDIAAGSAHSLALRADGVVFAWGSNADGALGNGEVDDVPHPDPTPVGLFEPAVDIAAGRGHSVALMADGTARAWGLGSSGQLGHGQSGLLGSSPLPVVVEGLTDGVAVSAAANVSHALRADGSAVGWGQNSSGQLGTGDTTARPRPTPLAVPVALRQVVTGPVHGLGLDVDGDVWAWGANHSGQLGVRLAEGDRSPDPVRIR